MKPKKNLKLKETWQSGELQSFSICLKQKSFFFIFISIYKSYLNNEKNVAGFQSVETGKNPKLKKPLQIPIF